MSRLRTWAEWDALTGKEALSDAERHLVECCKVGETCIVGDTRPDGPSKERTIRADLLRYLILGGCDDCRLDEWGVRLVGGYIAGPLDLSFGKAHGLTFLVHCRFSDPIEALQTRFESLNLTESAFPGLNAQGAKVKGDVFLRKTEAEGEVSLSGAKIGGQLSCIGATFPNATGHALNAQGAEVTDGVFLRETESEGEVSLSSAKIGGQLDCEGATFRNATGHALNAQGAEVTGSVFLRKTETEGEVSLSSAKIGGQLTCEGATFRNATGHALNAQRLTVTGEFFWRNVEVPDGPLSFQSSHVGDLSDDPESWPDGERLILDGFTYDRITAAFTDAPRRLDWLRRGSRWKGEFFPQPYTQLAKVLREMGHDRAARQVLSKRERLIRRQARVEAQIDPNGDIDVALKSIWADTKNSLRWLWSLILRRLVGYGYAPGRSVVALIVLLVCAIFLSAFAWNEGSFAPNSGPVLVSAAWADYDARDCLSQPDTPDCLPNPAEAWSAPGAPGADWDSFNRYGYAADLVVPILDLGQTAAWAPSKDRGFWGYHLWWGRWALAGFGWFFTALGAAAITGIIRRE